MAPFPVAPGVIEVSISIYARIAAIVIEWMVARGVPVILLYLEWTSVLAAFGRLSKGAGSARFHVQLSNSFDLGIRFSSSLYIQEIQRLSFLAVAFSSFSLKMLMSSFQ